MLPRQMLVHGLDFTSNPRKKTKELTLASGELEGGEFTVTELETLASNGDDKFAAVRDWLQGKGSVWLAGLDFPFSLPLAAVEKFGWLKPEDDLCWQTMVTNLLDECKKLTEFQDRIERWKRPRNRKGKHEQVKVHSVKRLTDLVGGSMISSPLKVRDFPAVGSMFYEGANLLLNSGVCIHPVRVNSDGRKVVEAYPALLVNRLVGDERYKDATGADREKAQGVRRKICERLRECNDYGLNVRFHRDADREQCIADHTGDTLDSVLCAVQAAWSASHRFGMPQFRLPAMWQVVQLEGWIADPVLFNQFKPL